MPLLLSSLGLASALVVATSAYAQADGRPHHKPPPEAYTSCASKAAAEACSVSFHGNTITGACTADSDAKLFCRPEHMPAPPSGNPPEGQPPEGKPE